jgi:hypothetical protein
MTGMEEDRQLLTLVIAPSATRHPATAIRSASSVPTSFARSLLHLLTAIELLGVGESVRRHHRFRRLPALFIVGTVLIPIGVHRPGGWPSPAAARSSRFSIQPARALPAVTAILI